MKTLILILFTPTVVLAQVTSIARDPNVQDALRDIDNANEGIIEEQIRIAEIPAPPFGEAERAQYIAERFQEIGLTDVHRDLEGNVVGAFIGPGTGPLVVLSAHLDTVFPEGTDVRVKREGTTLIGPGIGDNARGLAVLLVIAKLMKQFQFPLGGTIHFVATIGEEGLGNLRGVRYLFDRSPLREKIEYFVAIDGTDIRRVVHKALGSKRYRVVFRGPGGHSWSDFGIANPIHALGRAINAIAQLEVPVEPKTSYNVGRVGGGTAVNAVPLEAWIEVDLRSESNDELQRIAEKVETIIEDAVNQENALRSTSQPEVTADSTEVGSRPSGEIPVDNILVRLATDSAIYLGYEPKPERSSTDSNYPISIGIPAITIGGGGTGGSTHSVIEWFDASNSADGVKRALLLMLGLLWTSTE
ncbi:MAG: M20/M25/M40 family metallo-hydrolase [Bacteroidota bacterium]